MPSYRVPRGYTPVSWPYHEIFEGSRPSLPGLQPAQFLPVYALDEMHDDDPVVIVPGTFVGRIASSTLGSLPASMTANRPLVPACPTAYTVTYSAYDYASAKAGGTPDIDGNGTAPAADTNASSVTIGPIKPIGLVPQPVYASYLGSRFSNYDRNMETTQILVQNQAVLIPAITAAERAIEIGDKVCLDFTGSPTYKPTDLVNSIPGRLQRVAAAVATAVPGTSEANIETGLAAIHDYTVGRCIDKFVIAKQTSTSAGQLLSTALSPSVNNVNTSTLSTTWGFHAQRLVQTVPGLGLSGSGTQGIPPSLTFAAADASGYFWGLVIVVQVA